MLGTDLRQEGILRNGSCGCPPRAGNAACDRHACPECGQVGKPVEGQTLKACLSVSLRSMRDRQYFFCKTPTCSVVYFDQDRCLTFSAEQVREKVYQKEPEADDVFICYCFRYTVGDFWNASPQARIDILADIQTGIHVGQCACDLRNPQGSCCLGNVRRLIKRLETTAAVTT